MKKCKNKKEETAKKEEVVNKNNVNEKQENAQTTQPDNEEKDTDELTEALEKNKELNDKYLRLYAEYDNYRRRTAQEKIDSMKMSSAPLMKDLLPVLDDYERAIDSINKMENKSQFDGIVLIYNKFLKTLKDKGLEEIEAKGKEFNTDEHEALTMVPGDESMKNKVVDVITKGYKLNGTVIRYARVVVGA